MTDHEKLKIAEYVIEIIDDASRDSRGMSKIWVSDWMTRAKAILIKKRVDLNKSIARLGR